MICDHEYLYVAVKVLALIGLMSVIVSVGLVVASVLMVGKGER